MTDKESLSKLEKILKQLEKISNNTGVSAGVKTVKGETKNRANLTSEEIARETKIARIYKSILGTGFDQVDEVRKAEIFRIKLGITTTYYVKTESFLKSIKDNIEKISNNLNFSKIELLLNNIKLKLDGFNIGTLNFSGIEGLLNDIKLKLDGFNIGTLNFSGIEGLLNDIKLKLDGIDFTVLTTTLTGLIGSLNFSGLVSVLSDIKIVADDILKHIKTSINFTNIETILKDIETNTKRMTGSGGGSLSFRDTKNAFIAALTDFKRSLKWEDFRKKIIDHINSSKGGANKVFEVLQNVGGLALLGTGLLLVVTALAKTGMVDVGQSLKVMGLVTFFVGVLLYLADKFNKIQKVGKNLAILMGTVMLTTLALVGLSKLPVPLILMGIIKTSFVYTALYFMLKSVVKLSNSIQKDKMRESVISLGIFTGILIATTLALVAISFIPFPTILSGLFKLGIVASVMYGVLFLFKKLKAKDLQDTMKSLAMFVGITTATLLLTIAFSKVPFAILMEGLGKMILVSALLLGVLKVMEMIKPKKVISSMLGLVIFAGVLYFGILPLLDKLKNVETGEAIKSIIGIGLALTAFTFLVRIIGQLVQAGIPQMIIGAIAIVGLTLILGYITDNLSKLADKPWGEIYKGLGLSVLAITLFGVAVAAIGALMLTGVGAAVLAAGGVAVLGLSFILSTLASAMDKFANKPWDQITNGVEASIKTIESFGFFLAKFGGLSILLAPLMAVGSVSVLAISNVMGSLAESLSKYQNVDGENLKIVGEGLQSLGLGLMAILGGSIAGVGTGVIDKLGSFFSLDPVSQIKKFEKVDVEKIYKLGEGVKMLGEGLRNLSSSDINLTKITDGVIKLTKPLAEFSGSLEKFSDAYTKFEKVKMDSDKVFNIEADTGLKQAIKEATDRQLNVQMEQLTELKRNNELMEILINRSGNSGGITGAPFGRGGGEESINLTSPVFKTKNDYLSNVKMMTMSISNA